MPKLQVESRTPLSVIPLFSNGHSIVPNIPSFDMYKPLRTSQILRSEEMVKNVVSVLSNEYINPFGSDLDKDQLFNLSSSAPIDDSNAVEQILNIRKVGKDNFSEFKKNRLSSKLVKFRDPIKRNDFSVALTSRLKSNRTQEQKL